MKLFIKIGIFISLITLLFTSCEKNEITRITLSSNNLYLTLGEVDSLYADVKFTGDITPTVTWTVDNPNIAVVSNGQVTGKNVGTTVVTAKSGEKIAKCEIIVTDIINPQYVKGDFQFYGDVYSTGKSNNIVVYLATSGINMNDFSGDGEILYLEMNIPLDAMDMIPSGTYQMVELDEELFTPFTLVPAFYYDNGNNDYEMWGTWYFGRTINDIVSGSTVVTHNSGINYTITYNLKDYFGNRINGSFTGNLVMYDSSMNVNSESFKSPRYSIKSRLKVQNQERIKHFHK